MKKLMMIGLVTLPLVSGCATKMETGTALGALDRWCIGLWFR